MKVKKSDFILIGAVILFIVIGVFSTKGSAALEDVEYPLVLNGAAGLTEISYNDYENLMEKEEAFIIIVERASCSYCQMYLPILEDVANEKQIPIYYIDTDTLSSEDFSSLGNSNSYLRRNSWGTPTTLFMLGNRVLDSIGGYVEKEEFLSLIKPALYLLR